MDMIEIGGLRVARVLHDFVAGEAAAGLNIDPGRFWTGFAEIVRALAPRNLALLRQRDELQSTIDAWHAEHRGKPQDIGQYTAFLREIGYLLPEPAPFSVTTEGVDAEIAHIAGPQLVVPVMNARYALNAANARWGSLYDALYGTDAIDESDGATRGGGYNPKRGAKVIARARAFLDRIAPLAAGSHADAAGYAVDGAQLAVTLKDGTRTALRDPAAFVAYRGDTSALESVLLRHHGLFDDIVIPLVKILDRARHQPFRVRRPLDRDDW